MKIQNPSNPKSITMASCDVMHSTGGAATPLVLICLVSWAVPALANPPIVHDEVKKVVTMADARGDLLLRVNYDGRCMLDQVIVRGRDVVSPATGAYSSIRVGTAEATTRKLEASPQVAISENTVTVSGIRFVGGGIDLEETWTFAVQPERIVWRIARKYLNAGTLDDTCFPGFDFTSLETWTGALLDTGGVAWFKLFDTPVATYGVHASQVTFWNKDTGAGLRIVPTAAAGQQGAVRFSRQPSGVLSFNYLVTADRLAPKQGLYRFLRDKQDVWAPFRVTPGEMVQEMELYGLDYQQTYDRGELKGIGGAAVREICNTIARLGVIDRNIIGSNGWYSGYAVLQEQWLAQLGLAIDDPAYFQVYGEALDYQREHAIAPDGRIKSRWAYGPWDAMPGTYDPLGFYEAQWGYFLDSQPDWVINVAEQFDFTGDRPWVSRQKAACEQALDFMLRRDSNHNGLVEIMTNSHEEKRGGDWLDIIWSSFEPATINAQMYEALVLWADVEEELGDPARAAAYRKHAATLKAAYNRPTAEGGFWNPEKKWYVHWRDRDGSIHGDNLVLPVNFMAIGYGLCDDPVRRDAILRQVEEQMQKEKLFFWPACIYSYRQEEGHDGNWPFPKYENGDIFLAWGELGTRAYAAYDPRVAVRCVQNVLDQYAKDGLAFQRYSRSSQTGVGDDILSNMANPIVGLYRNIYGIQPKWNRLYLEPHMTKELDGTRLKYWLRGQWYTLEPGTDVHRIAVDGFAVSDSHPLAVAVKGDTLDYFRGKRKTPSMTVTRSATVPLELRIETWPDTGNGARKWSETCGKGEASTRHVVCDLVPNTDYKLSRNGVAAETLKSDAAGCVTFEVGPGDSKPMVLEITGM